LVLVAAQFAAVWLKAKVKLEAWHVLQASKRIFGVPDFKYYTLADGLSAISRRVGKGLRAETEAKDDPQLELALLGP